MRKREREGGGVSFKKPATDCSQCIGLLFTNPRVFYSISLHVYLTDFEFVQLYLHSVGVDNNVKL